jgi:hypothetical protein
LIPCNFYVLFVLLDSGKCECALFSDYVDELRKKMGKSATGLPIVVVQFAKVKIFRGNVHNVVLLIIELLIYSFLNCVFDWYR